MKQDIKEITEQLEQGVKEVFENDKYKEYLNFVSRFYNYSANNILLIMLQRPQATLVAGYKDWQEKFNRQVRKGEHGIRILAPCLHKKVVEKDGEERLITWTTFRTVTVFDLSQTDGQDIPIYVKDLTGRVDNFSELVEKLKSVSPVPVGFEPIEKANGFFHLEEKRIAINERMSEQQTIKTLVHKISHAILHDRESGAEKDADRNTREVQAESIAYTVCLMLGLDTSDYSFGYVAGWSNGREVCELKDSMEVIRKTAKEIIEALMIA